MTREERIRAAIAGRETDRVPVAAWMHLSEHDQDPISLAEAEVELTEKYDFDYIKMMPFGLYSTQDFGNQVKIYCDPYKEPIVQKFAIDSPAGYDSIRAISALQGTYGKQVEFARELAKHGRNADYPDDFQSFFDFEEIGGGQAAYRYERISAFGSPCIGRYYSDDDGFCRVQYRCRCGRILFCYAKCRKDNDDGRRI